MPLRATADAILVNWLCIETFNAKGKRTYYNSFVSDLAISSAIDRGSPVMEQSHTEIARCFSGLANELTRNDVDVKRAAWSLFKTV